MQFRLRSRDSGAEALDIAKAAVVVDQLAGAGDQYVGILGIGCVQVGRRLVFRERRALRLITP